MATPPPPVNLWLVLSESKRIINAHSRHFLALSVLFLLPPCFFATVYPSVFRLLTGRSVMHDSVSLLRSGRLYEPRAAATTETAVVPLLIFYTVTIVFNLLAIGSITYSVFQGFYGRPVKLLSAVKSGFTSFFPLLVTQISAQFIISGILTILVFSAFVLIAVFGVIGLEFDYSSPSFLALFIVLAIVSMAIVINLAVNWILALVIVVVESTRGFAPLKRSKNLMKGMRGVSFSLIFFFFFTESVLIWSSYAAELGHSGSDGTWWTKACFVLQFVITSAFLTLLSLYNMAANTVMYMYCKAVHGELELEIAKEFAREYVSLPFDDGKVPHLVSVAYNV